MSLTPHVAFSFFSVGRPRFRLASRCFGPYRPLRGHRRLHRRLPCSDGLIPRWLDPFFSTRLRFPGDFRGLSLRPATAGSRFFPPHWLTVATVRSLSDRLCSRRCPSFNRSDFPRVTRLRDWLCGARSLSIFGSAFHLAHRLTSLSCFAERHDPSRRKPVTLASDLPR